MQGDDTLAPRSGAHDKIPFHWKLFDPINVFGVVADFLAPLRYPAKLILPLCVLAAFTAYFNRFEVANHFDRIFLTWSFAQQLLLHLVLVNLLSKVTLGVVMSAMGADPREFGVRLLFGFLPGFYVIRTPINDLPPDDRVRCLAAPLLAKMAAFSVGMVMWGVLHQSGSGAADFLLALSSASLGSFLLLANPLWRGEGYFWLAAKLRRPRIREHSFKLLAMLLTGRRPPADLPKVEAVAMLVYALLSICFTALIALTVLSAVALALEAQLAGTGVVMFCLMLGMAVLFVTSLRRWQRETSARSLR